MKILSVATLFAASLWLPAYGQDGTTAKPSSPGRELPKIHIVEVVDASGCKGLRGGLGTSGGMLAGLGVAKATGSGVGPAFIGKAIGGAVDKASRCRQAINIDPAAPHHRASTQTE